MDFLSNLVIVDASYNASADLLLLQRHWNSIYATFEVYSMSEFRLWLMDGRLNESASHTGLYTEK